MELYQILIWYQVSIKIILQILWILIYARKINLLNYLYFLVVRHEVNKLTGVDSDYVEANKDLQLFVIIFKSSEKCPFKYILFGRELYYYLFLINFQKSLKF